MKGGKVAQKHEVLTDVLDRITKNAGFWERDGRPKKVVEHHKGDIVEFTTEERVEQLVAAGAIRPVDEDGKPTSDAPEEPVLQDTGEPPEPEHPGVEQATEAAQA